VLHQQGGRQGVPHAQRQAARPRDHPDRRRVGGHLGQVGPQRRGGVGELVGQGR
jgi:hypothetical protein